MKIASQMKEAVSFSPGVDPSKVNKKDYQVGKVHFRCVHPGCKCVLSRQCWRPHIEMDHINGRKTFKKKHFGETFACTDCGEQLPTRRARELHRRKFHSISKQIQQERLQKRIAKAEEKERLRAERAKNVVSAENRASKMHRPKSGNAAMRQFGANFDPHTISVEIPSLLDPCTSLEDLEKFYSQLVSGGKAVKESPEAQDSKDSKV